MSVLPLLRGLGGRPSLTSRPNFNSLAFRDKGVGNGRAALFVTANDLFREETMTCPVLKHDPNFQVRDSKLAQIRLSSWPVKRMEEPNEL